METITRISQHIMNVMRKVFGRKQKAFQTPRENKPFVDFSDYCSTDKENVFQSCHFSDLRISTSIYLSEDFALKISTSYPHRFSEEDAISFALQVLEIVWMDASSSHEIVFHLSFPASKSAQDRIMTLMFSHLCSKYEWMYLRQTVYILKSEEDDFRSFFIKLETRNHLRLVHILFRTRGIDSQVLNEEDLGVLSCQGNYEIVLFKSPSFSWDEIMPNIEEVFNNYFLRGVDFVPMNE